MRFILGTVLSTLAFQPLLEASECDPPPGSAYDADLFHKDVEVWYVSAEFLYWTVDEGALDYAQKMRQPAWSPTTPSFASGKVQCASFNLDPGFRVATGYFNAPKYWAVQGQYTHLITRGKDRAGKPEAGNEFLTGTWPQITTNPLVHAHSNIFFNYNLAELSIDRIFITNPHLRMKLRAALSMAWMQQDWKVQYFDGTGGNTTIRNRWHYMAGGLRAGLLGDWYWGNHVYLTGGTTAALYMGGYSNDSKQTTSFQPNGSDDPTLPVRDSRVEDTRPSFAVQVYLGPSYQKCFGCNRVEIFAGYELTGWFNLQEIRRSSSGLPSSAKETWMSTNMLALQGLTTRLTVDF